MNQAAAIKTFSTLLMGVTLMSFSSCQENMMSDVRSSSYRQQSSLVDNSHFKASLTSINSKVAGSVQASAKVQVEGGKFMIEMDVTGVDEEIEHPQHIHLLSRCPTLADDTNKDGIIDMVETSKISGEVLIALDDNLETKTDEGESYPVADVSGHYLYSQDVMVADLMKSLNSQSVNLDGKVIIIHGVSKDVTLPDTVQAMSGQDLHETLPVACGKLSKVSSQDEADDQPKTPQTPSQVQQIQQVQQVQQTQVTKQPQSREVEIPAETDVDVDVESETTIDTGTATEIEI